MARQLNKRSAKPIAQPKPTVGQTRYASLPEGQEPDAKSRKQADTSSPPTRNQAQPAKTQGRKGTESSAESPLRGRAEQPQVSWRHTGADRVGKERSQAVRGKASKAVNSDAPDVKRAASANTASNTARPKAIGPRPITSKPRSQASPAAQPEALSEAKPQSRPQSKAVPAAETDADSAIELVTFAADGTPSDLAQASQQDAPQQATASEQPQREPKRQPSQARSASGRQPKGQRQAKQTELPAAVALAAMPESEYTTEQAVEAYSAMADQVQQIQADPLYADMMRKNHPADPESYDPYAAAGEPARRVHYFQQADRALAKAEGGEYTPERAEKEYGAEREAYDQAARGRTAGPEPEPEPETDTMPAVQAGVGQLLDPQALAYESNQALQDETPDQEPEAEPDKQSDALISDRMADQLSDKIASKLASQLSPLQASTEAAAPEARVPAKRSKAPVRSAIPGSDEHAWTAEAKPSKTQPKAKPKAVRAAKRKLRDPQQVVAEIMQRVQAGSGEERTASTFEPETEARSSDAGGLIVCERMTTRIVCVHEDARLAQLGRLFIERGLTAVPVVKARSHKLVGLITLADLFCEAYSEGTLTDLDSKDATQAQRARDLLAQPVKDYMQTKVLQVEPDCPVQEACRLMAEQHVHHLVVTRAGVVTGIFTAFDAMRILAGQAQLSQA